MNLAWNNFVCRYYRAKTRLYYRWILGSVGATSMIMRPILLCNPQCLYVGNRVQIRQGARIDAVCERGGCTFSPRIEIGDDTLIEQGLHMACAEKIVIGKKVAITQYVGIFDIWHSYEDVRIPIVDQPLKTAPVSIGDNCLIGMGAVIQPGVAIGRHCVIGANSVVTKSIPEYCVAVGSPAQIIRRFDPVVSQWIIVKNDNYRNQK